MSSRASSGAAAHLRNVTRFMRSSMLALASSQAGMSFSGKSITRVMPRHFSFSSATRRKNRRSSGARCSRSLGGPAEW